MGGKRAKQDNDVCCVAFAPRYKGEREHL